MHLRCDWIFNSHFVESNGDRILKIGKHSYEQLSMGVFFYEHGVVYNICFKNTM